MQKQLKKVLLRDDIQHLPFDLLRVIVEYADPTPCFYASIAGCDSRDESTRGAFNSPRGLALDEHRNLLYVCDTFNHRIQVLSPQGDFVRQWGSEGCLPGQLSGPRGIAVDSKREVVYVADTRNHRVQVFTPTGDLIREWGAFGKHRKQSLPLGIALAVKSNLLFVSYMRVAAIDVFTPTGELVRTCGRKGHYIVVMDNSSDVLYALERDSVYLEVYSNQGDAVRKTKITGCFPRRDIWLPAIAINTASRFLYVTNTDRNCVHVLNYAGVVVYEFSTKKEFSFFLSRPTAITCHQTTGMLYIADAHRDELQLWM